LLDSNTFMTAGRDLKSAEWSYRVKVTNLTRNVLSGAQLEYRIVFDDEVEIAKDVIIGNYVWVGSRVTILPGTELGDGCIVQAGAVVSGKFPANAIVGGNPARTFAVRDADLVKRLVAEGKFLF
jgi:acetyltransferase-like isoleucine patch superfamily enzyme